jgi:hypothetical protein
MTEPPLKGKQPLTKYKPSRLSKQVKPESTDDEGASERFSVQVPDIQMVVPETQFEHLKDNDLDQHGPLSPRSTAMLDRNTIKKRNESIKACDFTVKLFKKPVELDQSTSTPESSVRFCFGQPNTVNKQMPNVQTPTAQSETESSITQHEARNKCQPLCLRRWLITHQMVLNPSHLPSTCQPRLQTNSPESPQTIVNTPVQSHGLQHQVLAMYLVSSGMKIAHGMCCSG